MRSAKLYKDPRLRGVLNRPAHTNARRKVYEEIEKFCGKPITNIADDYWASSERESELLQTFAVANSEAEIVRYYARTERYLYELAILETKRSRVKRFIKTANLLSFIGVRKVLDYGGGIGGLVIFLRQRGFECDYLDVPGHTFNFALFRFKQNGISPRTFDATRDVEPGNYDAVCAMDCFEHLFDLESALKKISRLLRDGGYLIQSSAFHGGGIHLKKNEKYSDIAVMNQLFSRYNLYHVKEERRFLPGIFARVTDRTGASFLAPPRNCQIARSIIIHRKLNPQHIDTHRG